MFGFSTKFDKSTKALAEAKNEGKNMKLRIKLISTELQFSNTNVIFLFHMEVEQLPWNIGKF